MENIRLKHIIFLLFLVPAMSMAQEKWTLTFRPAVNFLTTDISSSTTKTGYGFEFTGSYGIIPNLDIYAGWGWNQFKGDDFFAAENSTFNVSGANLGLRYIHPISSTNTSYNLMLGTIYDQVKIENPAGDQTSDTDYDFGWQVGGGITYTFGGNWQLQPEIRYRSLSTETNNPTAPNKIKFNYLSFGIGLNYHW